MAKKIISTGKIYIDESLLKQSKPTSVKDTRGLDRKYYELDLSASTTNTTNINTNTTNINTNGIAIDLINTNADGLKRKVLNIGTWNMHAAGGGSQTKTIAHGITQSNIRNAEGVLVNNALDTYYASGYIGAAGDVQWTITTIGPTLITVTRRPSGDFDAATFDGTGSINRGYLIIDYV